MLNRIIVNFLKTSPRLLAGIRTAIETNNPKMLQSAAHTMKSSNGQIGARQMASMCHELELMATMGTIIDGPTPLTELENELQKVELALTSILGQLGTK